MRSLRARLTLGIASAVLLAVTLTLLAAAFLVDRSLNKGAVRGLERQAALLAKTPAGQPAGPFGRFLQTQDERLAVLSRRQASLLLPGGSDPTKPSSGHVSVNGTAYIYAAQPSGSTTIVLLRTESSVASDYHPYLIAFAAVAGFGAVLAALVAAILAGGIARSIGRVAAASRRLAGGEQPEPLPESGADEVRTLAKSFNQMAVQLARARAAEREFLISVSHELKTPLTAIRGYAEAIGDGVLTPARAVEVINIEAARLERLVADLLELARLNRIGFDIEYTTIDLAEVAREASERHAPRARELGVSLGWSAEAGALALGDHDRVLQAVSNLVENALRCTPHGGSVSIQAAVGSISVADTGPGLAAEDVPRAFERFFLYRRYGKERPVGTGLGLSIVRELARAMGGDVDVESKPGAGATFKIRLRTA